MHAVHNFLRRAGWGRIGWDGWWCTGIQSERLFSFQIDIKEFESLLKRQRYQIKDRNGNHSCSAEKGNSKEVSLSRTGECEQSSWRREVRWYREVSCTGSHSINTGQNWRHLENQAEKPELSPDWRGDLKFFLRGMIQWILRFGKNN